LTGVEGFKPERFKNFTEETTENEIISKGMTKYDDNTYYEDLGVDSSSRRHILVFNSELLVNQQKAREKHIGKTMEELEEEKNSLMAAKKSRNEKPTEKSIDGILEKFKVNGYLDYSLECVVITTKRGF
jgi:hypothetical protein